jgi:hypothetical protein
MRCGMVWCYFCVAVECRVSALLLSCGSVDSVTEYL